MERRFTAALGSALALHVAFVSVGLWGVATGMPTGSPQTTTSEVEVTLIPRQAPLRLPPSEPAASPSSAKTATSVSPQRGPVERALTASGAADEASRVPAGADVPPAIGADALDDVAPPAASASPGRPIDLGLDGAIMARALRDTSPRAPASRRAVAFDGWSEGILRAVAHSAAPSEGSALLTLEWDANGQLASIRSSAASSHSSAWQKLAESLKSQLARRPQGANRGLRLVYLVKSEVVRPGQRSKLPESRHVSGEQLRDEHLPPAVSLNIGVKADTSAAGHRIVSVVLASSQVL